MENVFYSIYLLLFSLLVFASLSFTCSIHLFSVHIYIYIYRCYNGFINKRGTALNERICQGSKYENKWCYEGVRKKIGFFSLCFHFKLIFFIYIFTVHYADF